MHSDAIDAIRAHVSKLKRVKDEDLEGHEGNEIDKDEVTGGRLKTLCFTEMSQRGSALRSASSSVHQGQNALGPVSDTETQHL